MPGGGGCEESTPGGLQMDPPPQAVSWCTPGVGHGECVAGLLRVELGERLGLQLPGGGPKPPVRGPPGCPPIVSMPSEFSSISWMSGGIEPGISIFSVITRSAPAGGGTGGQRGGGCWHPKSASPGSTSQPAPRLAALRWRSQMNAPNWCPKALLSLPSSPGPRGAVTPLPPPLTFGADAAEICDLHQHFGEHVGFVGPPLPHVDLQCLQQRLLQFVHLVRLLQVLAVCMGRGGQRLWGLCAPPHPTPPRLAHGCTWRRAQRGLGAATR